MSDLRIGSIAVLLLVASSLAWGQQRLPNDVKQALSCAQSGHWLSPSITNLPKWNVGFDKSPAGVHRQRIAIAIYDRPRHGDFLEMRSSTAGSQRVIQLTNKGVFEFHNRIVTFPEAPNGGLWALPDLVKVLQKIDRQPKVNVAISQLTPFRQN